MEAAKVFRYKNVFDPKKGSKASFRRIVESSVKNNKGCAMVLVHPLYMDCKGAFEALSHLKPYKDLYKSHKTDLISHLRGPGEFVFIFVAKSAPSNILHQWIIREKLERSFLLIEAKDNISPSFSWVDTDIWKRVADMLKGFGVHTVKLAGELLNHSDYGFKCGGLTYGGCVASAGEGLSTNGIKIELSTELSYPNRKIKRSVDTRRVMELLTNI